MYDKNQLKSDSKKNDIMAYINKDKLNSINETFNRLGNGINLDQFIQIMLHFSENKTKEEDIEFIENVIDTFNIIDVMGTE